LSFCGVEPNAFAYTCTPLPAMAGFRDVRVRGHVEGAPDIVRDVVLHQLGDLERLVAAVRAPL
jgi:hypothetical protein